MSPQLLESTRLDQAVRVGATSRASLLAHEDCQCVSCGYAISAYLELPSCPMCRGTCWTPHRHGSRPASPA